MKKIFAGSVLVLSLAVVGVGALHADTLKTVNLYFDSASKVYGQPDPVFTYHVEGLDEGDTIHEGTIVRTPGEHVAPSGDYAIGYDENDPFTVDTNKYELVIWGGFFDILPKTLIVTADNKTKHVGQPDPVFTVHYSGFENGEDASVLNSAPRARVTATHTAPGTYAIMPYRGSDDDYDFSYVAGTLTVLP